jgi:hypothetical protein
VNPFLAKIDFYRANLYDGGISKLVDAFIVCSFSLESDVSEWSAFTDVFSVLPVWFSSFLQASTSLKEIDLTANQLTDNSALTLGEVLKVVTFKLIFCNFIFVVYSIFCSL